MEPKRKKVKYYKQTMLHRDLLEAPEDKGHSSESGEAWFHKWGNESVVLVPDEKSGKSEYSMIQVTVAIVEDCKTGKCYSVNPNDVTFLNIKN